MLNRSDSLAFKLGEEGGGSGDSYSRTNKDNSGSSRIALGAIPVNKRYF